LELEGKEIYISQKVDGSSTTFIFNDGEFSACSRRLVLKEDSGFPWVAANKYDVKNKMTTLGRNLAIQCESIGPKLNGNTMELKELEIKVFRIKDLDKREILGYYEMLSICEKLQLPHVDIIDVCKFDKDKHTIEYFRFLADGQLWKSNGKPGEGVVVAPTIPFYSPYIGKEWSLKLINQNYKQ
jgi:ATP-dependent RNA circularization protein (DNA/RNA ligase family)